MTVHPPSIPPLPLLLLLPLARLPPHPSPKPNEILLPLSTRFLVPPVDRPQSGGEEERFLANVESSCGDDLFGRGELLDELYEGGDGYFVFDGLL